MYTGTSCVRATGQVIAVTAEFADRFLDDVFVDDEVQQTIEGMGTWASGTMQFAPARRRVRTRGAGVQCTDAEAAS